MRKILTSLLCLPECSYRDNSVLETNPELFIQQTMQDVDRLGLGLVSYPRKVATINLTRLAMKRCIPGDVVETGLFTGGSSAVILRSLFDMDDCDRQFWGFDSFAGLPNPVEEDSQGNLWKGDAGQFSVGQEILEQNLKTLNVWDSRVHIVKGWFNESIPKVSSQINSISFLRLDGDMYQSTRDVLELLYHKLIRGGYIYIDDYGSFNGCRKAVNEFREKNRIHAHMHEIKESNGVVEAVWWRNI